MATPTLIATPGSLTANSYCTVAEGDTYHDGHLYSDTWTGMSTDEKTVALIMATRVLDYKVEWAHYPTNPHDEQILQWPRSGIVDLDGFSTVDDATIPQRLKEITSEYARQLKDSDRTADNDIKTQGITSISAGPISLGFDQASIQVKVVPDAVVQMIPSWWGKVRGNALTWTVLRG
jgi:hypothetical protein